MSATEGWSSIDDALEYLWPKIYDGEKYANPCPLVKDRWEKKLPRSVYIKACWPPTGPMREEFTVIHPENLHLLFDDDLW